MEKFWFFLFFWLIFVCARMEPSTIRKSHWPCTAINGLQLIWMEMCSLKVIGQNKCIASSKCVLTLARLLPPFLLLFDFFPTQQNSLAHLHSTNTIHSTDVFELTMEFYRTKRKIFHAPKLRSILMPRKSTDLFFCCWNKYERTIGNNFQIFTKQNVLFEEQRWN